jgi:mycoredoxin
MMITSERITVYGTPWCGDCRRALRVLDQHRASYNYVDIEADDEARSYVEQVNRGYRSVPTILFPDGSMLVEPSAAVLSQKLSALDS